MTEQKRVTLRDILVHVQAIGGRIGNLEQKVDKIDVRMGSMEKKMDSMELKMDSMGHRIDRIETDIAMIKVGVDNIDDRLDSIELSLVPGHKKLRYKVSGHGRRIRKLELHTGLVTA